MFSEALSEAAGMSVHTIFGIFLLQNTEQRYYTCSRSASFHHGGHPNRWQEKAENTLHSAIN